MNIIKKTIDVLYLKNCNEADLFNIVEEQFKQQPTYMKYQNGILHFYMMKINDNVRT